MSKKASRRLTKADRRELLSLLDHLDDMVRWCSCNMPDGDRFRRAEGALWAVAHRIAGNDESADTLIREQNLLPAAKPRN